jgi:queuine/archaeosine tRNA-ribosyltransferase
MSFIGPVQLGYCQVCKRKLRNITDDWVGRQYHKKCYGLYNHDVNYYYEIHLDIKNKIAKDKKDKDNKELIEIMESMGIDKNSQEKVMNTYKY